MVAPVLAGAEPFSVAGGSHGALVLHGFTGSPFSIRPVAVAIAKAGFSVEAPLLPGHGTSVADLVPTRWEDWSSAAETAYQDLAGRCEKVAVIGHSMGGTLSCWLAEHHGDVAGLVLINPLVHTLSADDLRALRVLIDAGETVIDGIGSDIAAPDVVEPSYDRTPLEALLSLLGAAQQVGSNLEAIACPVLLMLSRTDHIVGPESGEVIVATFKERCQRVWLEHSYHVATLDFDGEEVARRAVEFVREVTGSER